MRKTAWAQKERLWFLCVGSSPCWSCSWNVSTIQHGFRNARYCSFVEQKKRSKTKPPHQKNKTKLCNFTKVPKTKMPPLVKIGTFRPINRVCNRLFRQIEWGFVLRLFWSAPSCVVRHPSRGFMLANPLIYTRPPLRPFTSPPTSWRHLSTTRMLTSSPCGSECWLGQVVDKNHSLGSGVPHVLRCLFITLSPAFSFASSQ